MLSIIALLRVTKKKMSSKPVVDVYLNSKSNSAKTLSEHLAKHIDGLNEIVHINFIYISPKNAAQVQRKGIRRTPTLIYGARKFEGLDKILAVLTPPKRNSETYGYGVSSPDEMLHKWQTDIIDTTDEDEEDNDDMSPEARSNQLRVKMAQMQKQRPKMEGVPGKNKIAGGRKVKTGVAHRDYGNDDDFLKDSGTLSVKQTPTASYVEDTDGELMLEEYYLGEAYKDGKKPYHGKHKGHAFMK
jgi:hypothetical protein